jgi:hypothetical protein
MPVAVNPADPNVPAKPTDRNVPNVPVADAVDPVKGSFNPEPAAFPTVIVGNIAKFNNWDHRECCVENAQEWRSSSSPSKL